MNIKLFRGITHVDAVDSFSVNNHLFFVTPEGKAGKAIGKQGKNVKQLSFKLKKDVKIIEKADTSEQFVRNYLFPLKPKQVILEEAGTEGPEIHIEFKSSRERRSLLDNQQKGLKNLKEVLARYFPDITEVRVL